MCRFIGAEDLAANALIELYEKYETRRISFDVLFDYGVEVKKFYTSQSDTNKTVFLLLSRSYTYGAIRDYSNLFNIDDTGIEIRDGVDADDLRSVFRALLPSALLRAFLSEDAIEVLARAA